MKKFIDFIVWIFSDKYGKYSLFSEKSVTVEISKEIPDPSLPDYWNPTDPMDFITVGTGEFRTFVRQTWVAYHKKNGTPKYKTIDLP
jgi:hypothetical protein